LTPNIYTKEKIDEIINETLKFIDMHLLYYNKTIQSMICKQKIKNNKFIRRCSFDSYIKLIKDFISMLEYTELVKIHNSFHLEINNILFVYSKDNSVNNKLFNSLYTTQISLIKLLNNILSKFNYTKNNFDNLTNAWSREIFMEFIQKEYFERKICFLFNLF
jgi:diguanylate cyclase